jgi:hypothetical protein
MADRSKNDMEEGDKRAWQHAIESGALGTSLTPEESENLVLIQCYTAQKIDGKDSTSEADMLALLEWASGVRTSAGCLDGVVNGDLFVRMGAGDAEPTFQLSPKGEASARETARGMGLPVADDR